MDDGSRLPWVIVGALLVCAMFFAVTETAFASASKTKIKLAAERGVSKAHKALWVLENFDRAITTILIGTNIVHIAAASIVTVAVTKRWGVGAVSVSTLITTVVVFFLGEMLPKSIGKKYSESIAIASSGILTALMTVFKPLSYLLTLIGQAAAKLTKNDDPVSVTEDEIYDIIEDMAEDGTIDEQQSDLISSALQFGDVTVESVLTPRVDLAAIDIADSPDEILAFVKAQPHSRLPVYENSIDNIIGILQIRKFIKAYLKNGNTVDVHSLMDEAYFVHQSTNIDELLPVMSKRKLNIAVVTDNYGGTLGIVTMEDMLEELVGEIWDEEDVVEEPIVELSDGSFLVEADESVSDAFERVGFEDPEEDEELINTLMGEWAYEQFPAIPACGDSFLYYRLKVTIEEMDNHRIMKLRVSLLPEEEEGGSEQ